MRAWPTPSSRWRPNSQRNSAICRRAKPPSWPSGWRWPGDIYATDVTEKPGVRAYLEQMKNCGERMAVVTSAVPVHCRAALTHLGLLPYFERIFFAQELGTEKKYPVLWEKVAAALGVSPADCTLFDDSVEAIRGAKAAGMHTVGVADPYFASTADEMARTCDRYISGFGELRVSQLLCGLGGKKQGAES